MADVVVDYQLDLGITLSVISIERGGMNPNEAFERRGFTKNKDKVI